MLNRERFNFQPTVKPPRGNGHLKRAKKVMVTCGSPLGRRRQSQRASSSSPKLSSLPRALLWHGNQNPLQLSPFCLPLLLQQIKRTQCRTLDYTSTPVLCSSVYVVYSTGNNLQVTSSGAEGKSKSICEPVHCTVLLSAVKL